MSDQPVPDLTNPAPKGIGREPSPPQSLPSLGQSVSAALTPQSETNNVSSPALNDLANTASIDFTKEANGLQDTILSDILKAAAATPDLLQIPAISTSALLMSQSQVPTATTPLTVPPAEPVALVGSAISQSTMLDTMESSMGGSISAPDKHQTGIITTAGENAQSTSASQGLEHSTSQSTSLPWQEILMNMLSDIGFVETSRMMAAEELVLSRNQLENAPGIIEKYMKNLQESISLSSEFDYGKGSGSSKRLNAASEASPMDVDSQETIKRRRVDDGGLLVQMDATRHEIQDKMAQFMAVKREQINESNRQEFIKGRQPSDNSDQQSVEDDGCARVDARKLNRTIQMKLETVKNEALTKTNPKNVAQANDSNDTNGLDERLRNIQVHLNLRFAATPSCTLAERIRIIEDVIIQLEREYPLWSALHFNQPNRSFPPPPSVTTVSRNSRNQIVMTGDHLATTLIENGDPLANGVVPGSQYPNYTVAPGGSGSGTQSSSRAGSVPARTTPTTAKPQTDKAGAIPGAGRVAPATTAATGSATVIKLKRHGGAGSSSLARAVQQQLAQRKAAAGGVLPDDPKTAASTPSFKITPSPYGEHAELGSPSNLAKSGPGVRMSSPGSSPGSSLSPTIGFPDPSKPGVTGRGPIKSRRKSIAKGLDPASALASMNVAHTGGGHILGTNPGSLMTTSMGSPTQVSQLSGIPGTPSTSTPKPKTAAAKKPRKKKGDEEGESTIKGSQVASERGKGGFGLGKGKSGRPLAMGLGLGKGKGGAYREEILRRAEVEDFDDGSDDDMDDDDFQRSSPGPGTGNGGSMGHHPNPLAAPGAHVRNMTLAANNSKATGSADQYQAPKSKKKPQKPSTPAKPPAIRKFGGKSFGMGGGESSDSNESSDDGGSGSSGSQSDTSSSSSISGSDPGDSD
ncbi:hypothetical protein CPB97_006919 [Podila verticillata]|nr:hypothetical protein CPB97_006919 [Podila verticillata]